MYPNVSLPVDPIIRRRGQDGSEASNWVVRPRPREWPESALLDHFEPPERRAARHPTRRFTPTALKARFPTDSGRSRTDDRSAQIDPELPFVIAAARWSGR
jgi:hypothetical protein